MIKMAWNAMRLCHFSIAYVSQDTQRLVGSIFFGQIVSLLDTLSSLFVKLISSNSSHQFPILQYVVTYFSVCLIAGTVITVKHYRRQYTKLPHNHVECTQTTDNSSSEEYNPFINGNVYAHPTYTHVLNSTSSAAWRISCFIPERWNFWKIKKSTMNCVPQYSKLHCSSFQNKSLHKNIDSHINFIFEEDTESTVSKLCKQYTNEIEMVESNNMSTLQNKKNHVIDIFNEDIDMLNNSYLDKHTPMNYIKRTLSPHMFEDKKNYPQSYNLTNAPFHHTHISDTLFSSVPDYTLPSTISSDGPLDSFKQLWSIGPEKSRLPIQSNSFQGAISIGLTDEHNLESLSGEDSTRAESQIFYSNVSRPSSASSSDFFYGVCKSSLPQVKQSFTEYCTPKNSSLSDFRRYSWDCLPDTISESRLIANLSQYTITPEFPFDVNNEPEVNEDIRNDITLSPHFSPQSSLNNNEKNNKNLQMYKKSQRLNTSSVAHTCQIETDDESPILHNSELLHDNLNHFNRREKFLYFLRSFFTIGSPAFYLLIGFMDVQSGTLTIVAFNHASLASSCLIDWVSLLTAFILSVKFLGEKMTKYRIISLTLGLGGSLCIVLSDSWDFPKPLYLSVHTPHYSLPDTPSLSTWNSRYLMEQSTYLSSPVLDANETDLKTNLSYLYRDQHTDFIALHAKKNVSSFERNSFLNIALPRTDQMFGDLMCVAAAIFLGSVTVLLERALHAGIPVEEVLLKTFSAALGIGLLEFFFYESQHLGALAQYSYTRWIYFFCAAFTMTGVYALAPVLLKRSSSSFFNLSLLTSAGLSVLLSALLLGDKFSPLYSVGLAIILGSLVIYHDGTE